VRDQVSVEFGFCDRPAIVDIVGRAIFQIIPSEWYEGFHGRGRGLRVWYTVALNRSLDEIVKKVANRPEVRGWEST
jgi:hypothetical protein